VTLIHLQSNRLLELGHILTRSLDEDVIRNLETDLILARDFLATLDSELNRRSGRSNSRSKRENETKRVWVDEESVVQPVAAWWFGRAVAVAVAAVSASDDAPSSYTLADGRGVDMHVEVPLADGTTTRRVNGKTDLVLRPPPPPDGDDDDDDTSGDGVFVIELKRTFDKLLGSAFAEKDQVLAEIAAYASRLNAEDLTRPVTGILTDMFRLNACFATVEGVGGMVGGGGWRLALSERIVSPQDYVVAVLALIKLATWANNPQDAFGGRTRDEWLDYFVADGQEIDVYTYPSDGDGDGDGHGDGDGDGDGDDSDNNGESDNSDSEYEADGTDGTPSSKKTASGSAGPDRPSRTRKGKRKSPPPSPSKQHQHQQRHFSSSSSSNHNTSRQQPGPARQATTKVFTFVFEDIEYEREPASRHALARLDINKV